MTDAEKLRDIALRRRASPEAAADLYRIADLLEAVPPEILAVLKAGTLVTVPRHELISLQMVTSFPPQAVTYKQGWKIIDAAQALCAAIAAAPEKPE